MVTIYPENQLKVEGFSSDQQQGLITRMLGGTSHLHSLLDKSADAIVSTSSNEAASPSDTSNRLKHETSLLAKVLSSENESLELTPESMTCAQSGGQTVQENFVGCSKIESCNPSSVSPTDHASDSLPTPGNASTTTDLLSDNSMKDEMKHSIENEPQYTTKMDVFPGLNATHDTKEFGLTTENNLKNNQQTMPQQGNLWHTDQNNKHHPQQHQHHQQIQQPPPQQQPQRQFSQDMHISSNMISDCGPKAAVTSLSYAAIQKTKPYPNSVSYVMTHANVSAHTPMSHETMVYRTTGYGTCAPYQLSDPDKVVSEFLKQGGFETPIISPNTIGRSVNTPDMELRNQGSMKLHNGPTPQRPNDEKVITYPEGRQPRVLIQPELNEGGSYRFADCSFNPLPAYDLFYVLINPKDDFTIETNTLFCLCPPGNVEVRCSEKNTLEKIGTSPLKSLLNDSDYSRVMETFRNQLEELKSEGNFKKQILNVVCGGVSLLLRLFPVFLEEKPTVPMMKQAIDEQRYLMGWLASPFDLSGSGNGIQRSSLSLSKSGGGTRPRRPSGVKQGNQRGSRNHRMETAEQRLTVSNYNSLPAMGTPHHLQTTQNHFVLNSDNCGGRKPAYSDVLLSPVQRGQLQQQPTQPPLTYNNFTQSHNDNQRGVTNWQQTGYTTPAFTDATNSIIKTQNPSIQEVICKDINDSTKTKLASMHQQYKTANSAAEKRDLQNEMSTVLRSNIGQDQFNMSTMKFMQAKGVSVSAADSCNGPYSAATQPKQQMVVSQGGLARSPDAEGQSPQTGPGLSPSPREDPTSTTSPEGQTNFSMSATSGGSTINEVLEPSLSGTQSMNPSSNSSAPLIQHNESGGGVNGPGMSNSNSTTSLLVPKNREPDSGKWDKGQFISNVLREANRIPDTYVQVIPEKMMNSSTISNPSSTTSVATSSSSNSNTNSLLIQLLQSNDHPTSSVLPTSSQTHIGDNQSQGDSRRLLSNATSSEGKQNKPTLQDGVQGYGTGTKKRMEEEQHLHPTVQQSQLLTRQQQPQLQTQQQTQPPPQQQQQPQMQPSVQTSQYSMSPTESPILDLGYLENIDLDVLDHPERKRKLETDADNSQTSGPSGTQPDTGEPKSKISRPPKDWTFEAQMEWYGKYGDFTDRSGLFDWDAVNLTDSLPPTNASLSNDQSNSIPPELVNFVLESEGIPHRQFPREVNGQNLLQWCDNVKQNGGTTLPTLDDSTLNGLVQETRLAPQQQEMASLPNPSSLASPTHSSNNNTTPILFDGSRFHLQMKEVPPNINMTVGRDSNGGRASCAAPYRRSPAAAALVDSNQQQPHLVIASSANSSQAILPSSSSGQASLVSSAPSFVSSAPSFVSSAPTFVSMNESVGMRNTMVMSQATTMVMQPVQRTISLPAAGMMQQQQTPLQPQPYTPSHNKFKVQMEGIACSGISTPPADMAGNLFRNQLQTEAPCSTTPADPSSVMGRRAAPCRQTEVIVHRQESAPPPGPPVGAVSGRLDVTDRLRSVGGGLMRQLSQQNQRQTMRLPPTGAPGAPISVQVAPQPPAQHQHQHQHHAQTSPRPLASPQYASVPTGMHPGAMRRSAVVTSGAPGLPQPSPAAFYAPMTPQRSSMVGQHPMSSPINNVMIDAHLPHHMQQVSQAQQQQTQLLSLQVHAHSQPPQPSSTVVMQIPSHPIQQQQPQAPQQVSQVLPPVASPSGNQQQNRSNGPIGNGNRQPRILETLLFNDRDDREEATRSATNATAGSIINDDILSLGSDLMQ